MRILDLRVMHCDRLSLFVSISLHYLPYIFYYNNIDYFRLRFPYVIGYRNLFCLSNILISFFNPCQSLGLHFPPFFLILLQVSFYLILYAKHRNASTDYLDIFICTVRALLQLLHANSIRRRYDRVIVHNGARIKYKLMYVMVYF
jgi:hypothetical protein